MVRCGAANRMSVLPATTPARRLERDLPEEHRADDERAGIIMEGLTLMLLLVSPVSQLVHPISTVRCLLFLMLVESV